MTREEAVEILLSILRYEDDSKKYLALKMAIKALEQEPCEDYRMKLVQESARTLMHSVGNTASAKAFRNAGRFIQNAIDGEPPDFEKIEQPEPCEDAVSRKAAIDAALSAFSRGLLASPDIRRLPSVTPKLPECEDAVSRRAAIDEIKERKNANGYRNVAVISELNRLEGYIMRLPSTQPEIVRCKDCEYGDQDEVGRWFCRGLGCQIGKEDGSGYCADAERRTDETDYRKE